MNAAIITAISLICLLAGYRFYSRFLASKIFRTENDEEQTPAHTMRDDVDYVPAKRHVLWGHHFSSIAGAAPILGPAIAIVWGWLPALLWIVLGSVFMGAVHDFGALVISARHRGQSIGMITRDIIGPRARPLFLTIIFVLVFIVIAVFAFLIANLFVLYPGSVIPVNAEIIIALIIGYLGYKKGISLLVPSVIALVFLYFMIWVGFKYPVVLPDYMLLNGSHALTWSLLLLGYGFVAAVLPVWTLLQPRDLINSHQLLVGLVIIYAGIFISAPVMDAPAVNVPQSGNWFPFLFITIACGAISGFHALVATGTTSKQLNRMRDSRGIGYGSMMGEAALAIAATVAVAAGFSSEEAWHFHYSNTENLSGIQGQLKAFVEGTASFLTPFYTAQAGGGESLAAVFISVLVISFAATSLDTAIRIQRYIIGELGTVASVPLLRDNIFVQTLLAAGCSLLLILSGEEGNGGLRLWPLFGTGNQLLGSLTLLVISVWLFRSGINILYTLIPMIIITTTTFIATIYNLHLYITGGQWLLTAIALILALCQVWIIVEGLAAFRRLRRTR